LGGGGVLTLVTYIMFDFKNYVMKISQNIRAYI